MRIVFLPIDNRPVCYQLPKMIADINSDIELIVPPIGLLGDLTKQADITGLYDWLKNNINLADAVVLSLDTIAYGGLIPSRRSSEKFEEVLFRINNLKNLIEKSAAKIYAFSSIMRISNNNINQEEKEYWNLYGKKIFEYSYNYHKTGITETDIPTEILEDYLNTRKRNFEINKEYLKWQKSGLLDTLVFTKDDCAEYGLNVIEAEELEKLGGYTRTGADEIPLTLLGRVIQDKVRVCPVFSEPDSKHLISNYEDISIEESVKGQLNLAGCEISDYDSTDVILYVNNFREHQGEIVMKKSTELFNKEWIPPEKPYVIADVRLANGADNNFVNQILEKGTDENSLGFSAWNTSANTLGSLICSLKFILNAKNSGKFDEKSFKNLQAIRFLDDWAYQANVRQKLSEPDCKKIKLLMEEYEMQIKRFLGTDFNTEYSFPWNRLFEVKIELS